MAAGSPSICSANETPFTRSNTIPQRPSICSAPIFERILGDHRDALQSGGIGAGELGEPVIVRAKDGGHQRRVRHLEVKEPLRGIEDFAGHPIERHVLQVLLGVVPAAVEVLEAALGGDERI